MANLGSLQHSSGAQVSTVEQIRTEEAHPNPMRAVTVHPPKPQPAHDVVICWTMVGSKSTATDVTTTEHLAGTDCQDILFQK